MHEYTGKMERCPYCGMSDVRYCGIMAESEYKNRRLYEIFALWECKDCGISFRDYVIG